MNFSLLVSEMKFDRHLKTSTLFMSNSNLDNLNNYFKAKYSGYKLVENGTAMEFTTQDADYRVYLPTGTVATGGDMNLVLKLTHIRGGSKDDHATISLSYDSHGNYKSPPSISWEAGDDAQIPDWVTTGVKVVGGIATGVDELAGLFLAPESAGTSLAVAQAVAASIITVTKGVTTVISLYNDVAHRVCDLADDGGRLYFSNVGSHALNRINTSVLEYVNGGSIAKTLNYKNSMFKDAIGQGKYQDDKDGEAVEYHTDGDYYRTWLPDESLSYGNTGLLLSCKIDGVRDSNKDDHIALSATYDIAGNLYAAQAVLQMKNEDTVTTGSVTYNDKGQVIQVTDKGTIVLTGYTTVVQVIDNLLENEMKKSKHYDDYSDARKALPDIVQWNLKWMSESIVVG